MSTAGLRPEPAVLVDGVHKEFRIPEEQVHTLKERVLHPFRRQSHNQFQALRDVSFHVDKGEFFGIVGRNGSGKSTLLKCMAGIYGVDEGRMYVDGRVSTFIELGVGFNVDLPARDNILINATMLGLSQREARNRVDAVLDFAELHEFVDLKLKNYSSGMLVRLAFSVMIQVDADILLIDEVLAVGDAAFQQKCFDEFARLRRENRTVVLVTHDMGSVERFCDRAMLLERGHVVEVGEPQPVSMHYLQLNFSRDARAAEEAAAGGDAAAIEAASGNPALRGANPDELRAGDGSAEVISGWFMNATGEQVEVLEAQQRCTFCMHVRFHQDATDPTFAFALRNSEDERVVAGNTHKELRDESFAAGEEVIVYFGFENVLAPDRYGVTAGVAHSGSGAAWMDRRERMRSVVVSSTDPSGALIDPTFYVELQRQVAAEVRQP
ncbi:MAG TPA: ABC transporter ATP-binding protein [Baekduia sp.]|uniref:ABC transporter ATP-binding protein n=1 Tax=Baekduia sp. TaxID=2600305 RepID=UPI002D778195|nr:ABC transporter ATP-binding protein [Baekduia sp.]HET6509485.1 ABC transporter ATP-binding protein [Baekduia sp.]